MEEDGMDEQSGFRANKGTINSLFAVYSKNITETQRT
jgi:hypothetical protein